MGLAASWHLAGRIPNKEQSMKVEACFHEDGPGLLTGWGLDMLHRAYDSSPMGGH